VVLIRYTQPECDLELLLHDLKLELPPQMLPKISRDPSAPTDQW
jgi:hypothetical protein